MAHTVGGTGRPPLRTKTATTTAPSAAQLAQEAADAEVARLEKLASDFRYIDPGLRDAYLEKAAAVRQAADEDVELLEKGARPDPVVAIRRAVSGTIAAASAEVQAARERLAASRPGVIGMPRTSTKATTTSRVPLSAMEPDEKADFYAAKGAAADTSAEAADWRALEREARNAGRNS